MAQHEAELFDSIASVMRNRTGVDFGCYRPATVRRRIRNRMISVGTTSVGDYLRLLRASEQEADRLLERVTIKVSRLYRNPGVFDLLREQILPRLAMQRAGKPLRIWSAGCARGEEPFTLAMLLEDAGVAGTVLASDIDRLALGIAAQGVVDADALSELPRSLRERFVVEGHDDTARISARVRQRIRFEHRDLTRPLPASMGLRFDLVCCRNVLIYLKRAVQDRVQRTLRAALAPGGVLCLGEAEWPSAEVLPSLIVMQRTARLFQASARARGSAGA
jgi:chemotaxis methyl-accepting protein methylase